MGPHQRGKNGNSGRTCWAETFGSARLRPGTGDLDRSDSAIDAQETHVFLLTVDAFWSLKTNCDARGQYQSKCVSMRFPKEKRNQPWRHEKRSKKEETMTQVETRLKQPCIFDPKLVSREILERQFGFLFRPNIIKSTESSLEQTEWLTSATPIKIASVIVGLRIAIT